MHPVRCGGAPLEGEWRGDPVVRAFLEFARPGARLLDVHTGPSPQSHLAPTSGAEVLAVDPSSGPSLTQRLISCGWAGLDAARIEVGGRELELVTELAELVLPTGLVVACDAPRLAAHASSVCELREVIVELGYQLMLIDELRPGVLVRTEPDAVQPEARSHYLAVRPSAIHLVGGWRIEDSHTRQALATRLLDGAAAAESAARVHAAQSLADGPRWLSDLAVLGPARRALELDLSDEVRSTFAAPEPSVAAEHRDAAELPEGTPDDVVLYTEGLSVWGRAAPSDLQAAAAPDDAVVHDLAVHVRAGRTLAILAEEPAVAAALAGVLSGRTPPAAGLLEIRRRPVVFSHVGRTLEPRLSLRDNALLLAAFAGGHVGDLANRVDALAEPAGLAHELDLTLGDARSEHAVRLILMVLLACGPYELLLVDRLPAVRDPDLAEWVASGLARLRGAGTAIVQVLGGPMELLDPSARLMWLANGRVLADGHARSVLDAYQRRQLGLPLGAPTSTRASRNQPASADPYGAPR